MIRKVFFGAGILLLSALLLLAKDNASNPKTGGTEDYQFHNFSSVAEFCAEIKRSTASDSDFNLGPDLTPVADFCGSASSEDLGQAQCRTFGKVLAVLREHMKRDGELPHSYYLVAQLYHQKCSAYIDDMDQIRQFLDDIYRVTDGKSANVFIDYLLTILKDGERFDVATRYLAARDLVMISNIQSEKQRYAALDPVLETLLNDRNDIMRTSIAIALANSKDLRILPIVEYAYQNDPSFSVKEFSYRTLIVLTNGGYGGPGQYSPMSTSAAIRQSAPANTCPRECLTEDQYLWIKNHFIILSPELRQAMEAYKCD